LDGSSYMFTMHVGLEYASYLESESTYALLPVTKMIHFSIDSPSSYVVSVEFSLEEGADLLFDISSHSVIEDGVMVTFQTFVVSAYEFTGDSVITTDYFNAATSTLVLTSTADFEHPEFGSGLLQEWTLTLVEPSTECTTGVHTVPVTLDLASGSGTERIGLNIALADDYRSECSNNVGEFEIMSVVSVDAGEGFVLLEESDVTVLMDSLLYFSIAFSSDISPSTVSLVRADGSQDEDPVCVDCLASLAFTCTSCDETGVSSGATYEFGISMSSDVFNIPPEGSVSTVKMDFEFAFTYDGRRSLAKVTSTKNGARFFLRDYDCHSPAGLFGEKTQIPCATPGYVKTAFCHRSGSWKENDTCAPGEVAWTLMSFAAVAGGVFFLAFVYMAAKVYAVKPTHNYSPVQV